MTEQGRAFRLPQLCGNLAASAVRWDVLWVWEIVEEAGMPSCGREDLPQIMEAVTWYREGLHVASESSPSLGVS